MSPKSSREEHKENKIFAFLSYLSLLCIIPLIVRKDDPFVMEHGKQGLVLFVGETSVFILHIILGVWFFKLGIFVFGICSLAGMIAVLRGRSLDIPVITTLAKNITL